MDGSTSKKLTLRKTFPYGSGVANAILKIVNIYSSLGVGSPLTKRESEFYVALVICTLMGLHIYSDESEEIFLSIYGKHRKYARGDKLSDVIKKGWAREVGGDVELPPFLRDLDISEGEFEFSVNITWKEEES